MSGFTVTGEAIAEKVEIVKGLVKKAATIRGNAQKVLTEATVEALAVDVTLPAAEMPQMGKENVKVTKPVGEDGKAVTHVTFQLVDLAIFAKDLADWANQLCQETVATVLKSKDTGESVDALRAKYDEEMKFLEAMLTLAPTFGVMDEDEIEKVRADIPKFGKGGRPSGSRTTTTSRKPGSKFSRFYRIIDGEKRYQPDSQNSNSSMAWYFGAHMTGIPGKGEKFNGKGVSVDQLEAWQAKNGIDSPSGKPWSIEVDGVTYGMETDADQSDDVASEEE